MRLALLFAILSLTVCGCSSQRRSSPPRTTATPRTNVRTNSPNISVTPANVPATGRVSLVNGDFVILTYPIGKLPRVGQRLSVYRNGMKVGELKVSEPQHDPNTAADITAGEARTGDEARLN